MLSFLDFWSLTVLHYSKVAVLDYCDIGVCALVDLLGWTADFEAMMDGRMPPLKNLPDIQAE